LSDHFGEGFFGMLEVSLEIVLIEFPDSVEIEVLVHPEGVVFEALE
jgi:hypothetical protein